MVLYPPLAEGWLRRYNHGSKVVRGNVGTLDEFPFGATQGLVAISLCSKVFQTNLKLPKDEEEDEMKRLAMGVLVVLIAGCFAAAAFAQAGPRGTSTLTLNGKAVSVEYGRPSLRGRTTDEMLGKLPAGGFWRLGSNKAATFKTDGDLAFGDVTVPAGEYSIWMQRQSDNSWKLVFNKQHGQWGTDHDTSQDFASVQMKDSKATKPVEMVTLTLAKEGSGGTLTVEWGTLKAVASFTAK